MNLHRLSRVRGVKDESRVYFISYFHPKVALKEEFDYSKPLYDIIQEESGYYAEVSKEEISAIIANKELAKKLNINIGDPDSTLQYLWCIEGDWKLLLRYHGEDTTHYKKLHEIHSSFESVLIALCSAVSLSNRFNGAFLME